MRLINSIVVVSLSLAAAGCATTAGSAGADLGTAGKSLTSQTDAVKAVAKTESDAKQTVRRDESIRYWIARGDDRTGINLTSSNPTDSFARYACAGTGALQSVGASLTYLAAYASAAQASVDPGPDTFAGQFAKFIDQNSAAKVIDLPDPEIKAAAMYASCVASVQKLLAVYVSGAAASDVSDEFALAALPAAIAAVKTLISSLETLAKDGLKVLNEAQQRKHLKDLMAANAESLSSVESKLQTSSELDDAWSRREAFVLGTAYEKFKVILNDPNRVANAGKLRAAGLEVSSELAAYDAMAAAKPPSAAIKAWITAQNQLQKAVNDDSVSISAIVAYMQAAETQLTTLQKDYADTGTKFGALVQSVKAVGK